MRPICTLLAASLAATLLSGCNQAEKENATSVANTLSAAKIISTDSASTLTASEKANQLFDALYMEQVMLSPQRQTFLGMKDNQDKWDDISEAGQLKVLELSQQQLALVKSRIDVDALGDNSKLSYQLFVKKLEDDIADYQWRHHNYPVHQMFGVHSRTPTLLINQHKVDTVADADAYIARLKAITTLFDQLIDGLNIRADKGIIAPRFVFPHVIRDSLNIISGAPFDDSPDNALLADIKRKVAALDSDAKVKDRLLSDARAALLNYVGPAYKKLIAALQALQARADDRDGVWKFPEGEAYYKHALKHSTTTQLSADEIHSIGLREVERIHNEMQTIMTKVAFNGDMREFFAFMREDKRFYKAETEDGKQAFLDETTAFIDNMRERLDEIFLTKPKSQLVVKRVEAFREKSAGRAFYKRPGPDGSRPGIYYVNLYKMSDQPAYQAEALAFHEALPGHHMQFAIAQGLKNTPKFRRYGSYDAYSEGWGLYSEYVPKEMGFYQDPYSDFGRLAQELWRACRLVVDTGLHSKKWTRQQAIDYLAKNTPNPHGDTVKAIERYIVMPAQATSYKIGMLKILELRHKAREQLGDEFDIRQFHDVVLKTGPIPLDVLEQQVNKWIASKRA